MPMRTGIMLRVSVAGTNHLPRRRGICGSISKAKSTNSITRTGATFGRVNLSTRVMLVACSRLRVSSLAISMTMRMGPMITQNTMRVTTNRRNACTKPGSSSVSRFICTVRSPT